MDNDLLAPYDDAIARELDAERARRRMSIPDVAKRAQLNERVVRRYFRGERPIPVSVLMVMCLAMGVESWKVVQAAIDVVQSAEQESRG